MMEKCIACLKRQQYDGPYEFLKYKTHSNENGQTNITLSNGREITAFYIRLHDWNLLKTAITHLEYGEYNAEIGRFKTELLNDVSKFPLPVCNAGSVSPDNSIKGNCYNSNADTYATAMANPAYNVYFLYIVELECFAALTQKYYVY